MSFGTKKRFGALSMIMFKLSTRPYAEEWVNTVEGILTLPSWHSTDSFCGEVLRVFTHLWGRGRTRGVSKVAAFYLHSAM